MREPSSWPGRWPDRWGPFRVTGHALPPTVVLMVRLVALSLLLKRFYTGHYRAPLAPFAPFVPWFDLVPYPDAFRRLLTGTLVCALLGVLVDGRRIRAWCLVAAGAMFTATFAARFYYSNNKVFCASLLLLAGLMRRGDRPLFLWLQLALMYLAASLNKVLERDWLSGQYFDYWLGTLNRQQAYVAVADRLPPLLFGQMLAWGTIVVELALGIAFLAPRWRVAAAWLALYFHGAALLLSQKDFGVYTAALCASCLVVVVWPRAWTVRFDPGRRGHALFHAALSRLDRDGVGTWVARRGTLLTAEFDGDTRVGWAAVRRLLLVHPPVLFLAFAILTASVQPYVWWRSAFVALWLLVFCPLWPRLVRPPSRPLAPETSGAAA